MDPLYHNNNTHLNNGHITNNTTQYTTNHRQSFAPLPRLEPHLQQATHTLPPLQPQYSGLPAVNTIYTSQGQSPRNSFTQIPSPSNHSGSYPQYVPHSSAQFNGGSQLSHMQPPQAIQTPQYQLPPFSNVPSFQQNASSISSHNRHLPDLRPMPAGGLNRRSISSAPFGQPQSLPPTPTSADQDPQPIHVVGSQGRRGILPSTDGRPAAATNASDAAIKPATIPPKDAEGKFPCPHCIKTYLHAKHLKRHLLRHTGDRPYACGLCHDTFSRSDILKRHFQKCSIRRGNPTGESHLSHSQAHMKKAQSGASKPPVVAQERGLSDSETYALPNLYNSFNGSTVCLPERPAYSQTRSQSQSTPTTRRNSFKGPVDANTNHRRSSNSAEQTGYNNRGSFGYSQGQITPASIPNSAATTPGPTPQDPTFGNPQTFVPQTGLGFGASLSTSSRNTSIAYDGMALPQINGYSHQTSSGYDWNPFQVCAQDLYTNPMYPSTIVSQQQSIKIDPGFQGSTFPSLNGGNMDGFLSGIYGPNPTSVTNMGLDSLSTWNLDLQDTDPLQNKTDRLISYCFPSVVDWSQAEQAETQQLKRLLTTGNVKHFAELFANFHGHWPIIHMPSFKFMEAYDGLVLAMICVGAVYSDRINVLQVRALMRRAKDAVDRSTCTFADSESNQYLDAAARATLEIEGMQAAIILQTLATWHGDPNQRQAARQEFSNIAKLVRSAGLLRPAEMGSPAYSIMHQSTVAPEHIPANDWNWSTWIEQEKRSRLLYLTFLLDSALVIYFNCTPQFDPLEIRLPLPSDDAAWDATSAVDCANMLGLNGPAAQAKNITGSRRRKQPGMDQVMRALVDCPRELQARATNVYSKFILVHALHVQIWNVQRQLQESNQLYGLRDVGFDGSGNFASIVEDDWFANSANGRTSTNNSGCINPHDRTLSPTGELLKATTNALCKWKRAWDGDMALQYPTSISAHRRLGFCRDGIHFYWLASAFLQKNRASDWRMPADTRFMTVMNMLKGVRKLIAQEYAQKGEVGSSIGSVGDIDDKFGVEDLTLDMKLFFKPLGQDLDTPPVSATHVGPYDWRRDAMTD